MIIGGGWGHLGTPDTTTHRIKHHQQLASSSSPSHINNVKAEHMYTLAFNFQTDKMINKGQ